MKPWLRTGLYVLLFAAFAALAAVLVHLGRQQRAQTVCEELDVCLEDGMRFVTVEDVRLLLDNFYGTYIGQRIDDVDLAAVEKIIRSRSAVCGCEAWIAGDGILHVSVRQREPVIRFGSGADGFYCDASGATFPVSKNCEPEVPVVDGNFRQVSDSAWLAGMIRLESLLEGSFWPERIASTRVGAAGDIEFKLEGGPKILFGQPDCLEAKIELMDRWWNQIVPQVGLEYYKTVNVDYKGQIICRTRE